MRSIQKLDHGEVNTIIKRLKLSPDKESVLLADYVPLVVYMLNKRIRDRPLEKDDLQSGIIDAVRAIRNHDGKGSPSSLIGEYVNNGITKRFHRENRECRENNRTKFVGDMMPAITVYEKEDVRGNIIKEKMSEFLKHLPKVTQKYIKLRYEKGHSDTKIARKHGYTRQNINAVIKTGLGHLKTKLDNYIQYEGL